MKDDMQVAMKIQYPGVADSINSDIENGTLLGGQDVAVKRLLGVSTQGLHEFKNEYLKELDELRTQLVATRATADLKTKELAQEWLHAEEWLQLKLKTKEFKAKYKYEATDMFIGGIDTTTVTLQCSLAELINHPTVMEKARKEIDSIIGKEKMVMETNIDNLPYLQAIVKETLRLHPPSPFAIGRDPKYWDDPLEFRPERFLSNDNESGKMGQVGVRGQHYQRLPFGSGRKGCPRASLALKVAHTTLAVMI
ncbi:cytochrome P450 93A3-like [Glycine soja]|uniref:cytochrome P450 93A3-like n=1 Tax=Glycine soja TaxID=3848 RepID=UPI001039A1D3|nr:cytochrome P450 93A3-like [Glycine soja]